jgi:hypothetical protein
MAKKKAGVKAVKTTKQRKGKAVRLDLAPPDMERLERLAKRRGLTKASFARMALFSLMEQEETGGK